MGIANVLLFLGFDVVLPATLGHLNEGEEGSTEQIVKEVNDDMGQSDITGSAYRYVWDSMVRAKRQIFD